MSEALHRETLLAQLGSADRVVDALAGGVPAEYVERVKKATRDGAGWLALAATGDAQAVVELRVVKARVMLWSWAGAEHARQAWVLALREWLSEAAGHLADAGMAILEMGIRAMVDAGLNQLE